MSKQKIELGEISATSASLTSLSVSGKITSSTAPTSNTDTVRLIDMTGGGYSAKFSSLTTTGGVTVGGKLKSGNNDLLVSTNEFNFIPADFGGTSGNVIHLNYRGITNSSAFTGITGYYLDDGKGAGGLADVYAKTATFANLNVSANTVLGGDLTFSKVISGTSTTATLSLGRYGNVNKLDVSGVRVYYDTVPFVKNHFSQNNDDPLAVYLYDGARRQVKVYRAKSGAGFGTYEASTTPYISEAAVGGLWFYHFVISTSDILSKDSDKFYYFNLSSDTLQAHTFGHSICFNFASNSTNTNLSGDNTANYMFFTRWNTIGFALDSFAGSGFAKDNTVHITFSFWATTKLTFSTT